MDVLLGGIRALWTQQPEASIDGDGNVLLIYELEGTDGVAVVYWVEPKCIGGYRELVSGGLISESLQGERDSDSTWRRLVDDLWSSQPVSTRLGDPEDWVEIFEAVMSFADHLKSLAWVIRLEAEMVTKDGASAS